MAEPILKWAGGKRQLLDDLRARFPVDGYERFHEPFFGGGALFFAEEPDSATINDTNERLISFYRQIRNRPEEVITRLEEFRMPNEKPDPGQEFSDEKNYYYQQRARFNRRPADENYPSSPDEKVEEAALLLYLNRTCYNGLYRENSRGEFNVPIGDYTYNEQNPPWEMTEKVRVASHVLQALDKNDIRRGGFEYVIDAAEEDDLVYFDPPYKPVSATANFTDYSAEGFGQEDQQRLLETAKQLRADDVYVILSNSGVMAEFYEEAGFYIDLEGATRAINSDAENRDEVDEIIATNIPPENQRGHDQQELSDFR